MNGAQQSQKVRQDLEEIVESTDGLEFACIINKNGKTAHTINESRLDLNNKKKEMLFMETALQARMNKDFDGELGNVQCNVTERDDGFKYVSVPLPSKNTLFAVIDKGKNHESFLTKIINKEIC